MRTRVVAALLALLVVGQAAARLVGPSWPSIAFPFAHRELEGHAVAWEYGLTATAITGMLGSSPTPLIQAGFNTDHYRTFVPLYAAAVLSHWLRSSYWAVTVVDVGSWWLACLALYALGRRLGVDRASAFLAGALLAVSPLSVCLVGFTGLHQASAASLVPAAFAALVVMRSHLPSWQRSLGLGATLFAASLFYQYHWVVVPCLVVLAPFTRRPGTWLGVVALGTLLLVAMTVLAQGMLAAAGMPVHAHLNDPVRNLLSPERMAQFLSLDYWLRTGPYVARLVATSYHPLVLALAAAGWWRAGAWLRVLALAGLGHGLASAVVWPAPWTAMNGYAFIYLAAGLGLTAVPRLVAPVAARLALGAGRATPRDVWAVALAGTTALTLAAALSTNADLWGDYRYVVSWWDYRYEPR